MDKISESLENLKTIYLNEIHKDISLELDEEILEARKSQGFEKMIFWKSFAEKWLFVVAQRTPDLFEVFNGIFNDAIDIVQEGKQHMQDRWDEDKKCFNDKTAGLVKKIKSLEEDIEIGECKKKICAEEKFKLQEDINKLTLKFENIQNMLKNVEGSKEIQDLQRKVEDCEGVIFKLNKQARNDAETIKELQEKYEELRERYDDLHKKNEECNELIQKSRQVQENINGNRLTQLQKENSDLLIQNNNLLEQLTEFQLGAQPSLEKLINYSKITASSSVCNLKINERKNIIPKQPSKKQILKTRIAHSRELTLKQLKETIDEIYISKIKFDEKCFESHQPRETMDQFLHTYLNQKYGLRTLIVEWSVLILKATEKFESSDAEVSLFSKILSHRVEEDFRFTFEKLKEKIKQTLKSLIQQQNPYMREIQISNLVKEKMSGILNQYEWESIVYGILSKDEAGYLIDTINTLTEQKESKLVVGKRNKLVVEKNEPTFSEVQNAVLKYDLAAHETLLEPFWKIFTEKDRDNNGILNEDEFKELCIRVNLEGEVERLLDLVDPNSSGFINFSDCVNLFSFEMVDNGEQNSISVVHFLFFNSQGE